MVLALAGDSTITRLVPVRRFEVVLALGVSSDVSLGDVTLADDPLGDLALALVLFGLVTILLYRFSQSSIMHSTDLLDRAFQFHHGKNAAYHAYGEASLSSDLIDV